MKKSVMIMAALTLMLALYMPHTSARAQAAGTQPAAQDPSKEEADAYKAWYDAYNAKDTAKAYQLAKDFLAKYPTSKNADYLKKYVAGARGVLFEQARVAKNTEEMLRLGKEALAEDANNLDYLYLLAVGIRLNEMSASPPVFTHASEFSDYSQRVVAQLEQGKVPGVVDKAKWDKNAQLAYFYHGLAITEERSKNTDKALDYYMKASALDPKGAVYFFNCGRLHQEKYQAAAQKYQALPEADRSAPEAELKPEVKAALDDVNKQADAVIDCWARYMALTAGKSEPNPTRDQVEKALTALYTYRNPDSPDGLQKLIEHYRSGATTPPPKPATPAKPTTQAGNGAGSMPTGSTNVTAKPEDTMSAKPAASAPAKPKPNGARRKP